MYVPMTVHQSSVHRPLLYMRYPDSVVQNSASLINYGIEVAVYVTLQLTTIIYNVCGTVISIPRRFAAACAAGVILAMTFADVPTACATDRRCADAWPGGVR